MKACWKPSNYSSVSLTNSWMAFLAPILRADVNIVGDLTVRSVIQPVCGRLRNFCCIYKFFSSTRFKGIRRLVLMNPDDRTLPRRSVWGPQASIHSIMGDRRLRDYTGTVEPSNCISPWDPAGPEVRIVVTMKTEANGERKVRVMLLFAGARLACRNCGSGRPLQVTSEAPIQFGLLGPVPWHRKGDFGFSNLCDMRSGSGLISALVSRTDSALLLVILQHLT